MSCIRRSIGLASVDSDLLSSSIDVSHLYGDLVAMRVTDAQRELSGWSSARALSEGAECLSDAVAHVRDAAARLRGCDPKREAELTALAERVASEAAEFARWADLLASSARAG